MIAGTLTWCDSNKLDDELFYLAEKFDCNPSENPIEELQKLDFPFLEFKVIYFKKRFQLGFYPINNLTSQDDLFVCSKYLGDIPKDYEGFVYVIESSKLFYKKGEINEFELIWEL